jgi:F-type H+-transporting ATPase subunit b
MSEFLIIGSAVVAHNLANADRQQGVSETGHEAVTEAAGGIGESNHPDPEALGLNGTGWVSLAMLVFLLIVLAKGGLRAITGGLDRQIADIRRQLDEARTLRSEAEALRDEYTRKTAAAETTARDMIAHAEAEAQTLIAQAKADAAQLVDRRARMAEDKIVAAERAALVAVRAKAAEAATRAATTLIAAHLGTEADRPLVDRTIAGLGRPN